MPVCDYALPATLEHKCTQPGRKHLAAYRNLRPLHKLVLALLVQIQVMLFCRRLQQFLLFLRQPVLRPHVLPAAHDFHEVVDARMPRSRAEIELNRRRTVPRGGAARTELPHVRLRSYGLHLSVRLDVLQRHLLSGKIETPPAEVNSREVLAHDWHLGLRELHNHLLEYLRREHVKGIGSCL